MRRLYMLWDLRIWYFIRPKLETLADWS